MPNYLSTESRESIKDLALDIIQDIADVQLLGWRGDEDGEIVAKLRDRAKHLNNLATRIENGD